MLRCCVAPRAGARIETCCKAVLVGRARRSLPARERGSKRVEDEATTRCHLVAPRAGARIETCHALLLGKRYVVAPRAGARIETPPTYCKPCPLPSLPARERGSKHRHRRLHGALHASLPARERGSKHPARRPEPGGRERRSPRGSADRNLPPPQTAVVTTTRRSPRGSADRNNFAKSHVTATTSRSPRGSADRNCPFRCWKVRATVSLPARERGSKPDAGLAAGARGARRSPRGSADRNCGKSTILKGRSGRSPRGSADRNECDVGDGWVLSVAPRAGARIETAGNQRS